MRSAGAAVRRRRNAELDRWLQAIDETKWIDCPVGITAREKANPPQTRVQEIPSADPGQRVFVIDSEERRQFEEAMRRQAMDRTRQELERLLERGLAKADVELSGPAAMEAVSTLRAVTFRVDGQPTRLGTSRGSSHAHQVLRGLGITHLKPPTPPEGPSTVM